MRRRWLRLLLTLLAILLAGSFGVSFALQGGWARRSLLSRLSAGFGRPVEVGRFGFSLFSGARLEAQSITVYDDPRFGHEYFLRAERLTAGVRWSALVRGRFEFDTVSLTRPSLNLVRLSDGQWNIESWLPPLPVAASAARVGAAAASGAAGPPQAAAATARLSRIEVEDGRINFKGDSRKLPLALLAVKGRFDHDAAGHWNMDVQANPMRAPASLQQVGTLRVRGVVGGVSTRLRPASLSLTWQDASLADLSRLAQGRDYGIRGTLNAELTARIDDSLSPELSWGEWSVDGTIRLQGVHGWALAGRPTDPSANVSFQAKWRPGEYRLLLSRCVVEAPQSSLAATVDLDWSHGFHPQAQVISSRVGLADLLSWRRAFRADVADDLAVEGALEAQATLSGWPVHVEDLVLTSVGATVRSPTLPGPISIGPVATSWSNSTLKLGPTQILLPSAARVRPSARNNTAAAAGPSPPSTPLLVEGSLGPWSVINEFPDASYRLSVSGSARRAEDLLALARAWGWSNDSSWTAEGPVSLQLAWTGSLHSGTSPATGTIRARGVQLTTPLLSQPLLVTAATIDLRGQQRRINLQSLQAIGALWTGSLSGPSEDGAWDFDLAADHLDAADFYAWVASPARPNLLQRMLPFGASSPDASAARADALETLHASGRLRIAKLAFSPLQVEKIDAAAVVDGPSLLLRQGRAEVYGGQLVGDFEARLSAEPSYSFDGRFARIDLGDVAEAVTLHGRVAGLASGELKLAARGSNRATLAASLEGQGLLRAREASLGQFALVPAAAGAPGEPGSDGDDRPFSLTTRFELGAGRIRLDQLSLVRAGEQTEITGTVDFAGRLDLRAQSSLRPVTPAAGNGAPSDAWTIAGTLDAPRVASLPQPVPASLPVGPTGVPSASR